MYRFELLPSAGLPFNDPRREPCEALQCGQLATVRLLHQQGQDGFKMCLSHATEHSKVHGVPLPQGWEVDVP